MKKLLFIIIVCFSLNGVGQNIDSLGIDDDMLLNRNEAIYFNQYKEAYAIDNIDFIGKKVVFAYDNYAKIISKQEYFTKHVIPRIKNNMFVSNHISFLTEEETKNTNGIFAIVVVWSKIGLTKGRRKRIIKKFIKKN